MHFMTDLILKIILSLPFLTALVYYKFLNAGNWFGGPQKTSKARSPTTTDDRPPIPLSHEQSRKEWKRKGEKSGERNIELNSGTHTLARIHAGAIFTQACSANTSEVIEKTRNNVIWQGTRIYFHVSGAF